MRPAGPARIADAQRRLGLTPTGLVDHELHEAVRAFQQEQRFLVTGWLDEQTYHRLWETRLLGER